MERLETKQLIMTVNVTVRNKTTYYDGKKSIENYFLIQFHFLLYIFNRFYFLL